MFIIASLNNFRLFSILVKVMQLPSNLIVYLTKKDNFLFSFKITPIVILITLLSCSKPCEEAFDKTVKCAQSESMKRTITNKKDLVIKLCNPFKEDVKSCIKIDDCVKFSNCMEKATNSLRGTKYKKKSDKTKNKPEENPKKENPEKTKSKFNIKG
jgi:hypothetical protein